MTTTPTPEEQEARDALARQILGLTKASTDDGARDLLARPVDSGYAVDVLAQERMPLRVKP